MQFALQQHEIDVVALLSLRHCHPSRNCSPIGGNEPGQGGLVLVHRLASRFVRWIGLEYCSESERVRTKTYSPSWYEWYRRPFCGEGGLVGVRPGFLEVKYFVSKTLARELIRQ
jgi:hypothetical protein